MNETNQFTEGKIVPKLIKFALPVLLAMCLQSLYSAVDLLVVGQFGTAADVSAVSVGGQMMQMIMVVVNGLAMGTTILLGQAIGSNQKGLCGNIIGTSILFFLILGAGLTAVMQALVVPFAKVLDAPAEAFDRTVAYVRICSGGTVLIAAYNLLGSIFRGMGDSKTPLISVIIASVINIFGDLLFVAVFNLGASGAAIATVIAQLISVIISFFIIKRTKLPFNMRKSNVKLKRQYVSNIIRIGVPIALQEFLVGISFLVMIAIVNRIGVTASAGVGVANKVCNFIMLVPIAFMQSMSAFVAQNYGAGFIDRAKKALKSGIAVSFIFGIAMFVLTFFRGDLLAGIFSNNADTVSDAWDYLKAYAIDCLQTCFLFCFIGYYNGIEKTKFVMMQGICGAFLVRIPVAFLMQHFGNGSLFQIGLAIPCSTVLQIIMCFVAYIYFGKKNSENTL